MVVRHYVKEGSKAKLVQRVDKQSWHTLKVLAVEEEKPIAEKLHEILEWYFNEKGIG